MNAESKTNINNHLNGIYENKQESTLDKSYLNKLNTLNPIPYKKNMENYENGQNYQNKSPDYDFGETPSLYDGYEPSIPGIAPLSVAKQESVK